MSYAGRMARLTARKIEQTKEKQARLGARDEDDYGLVLPPESFKVDLPVRDATGQWSGPRSWAANFRWLMENHPCYIDPDDAIAGRWMFMLSRMRLGYQLSRSNFAFDYSHLEPEQKKYDITTGIGKDAHFAPDYQTTRLGSSSAGVDCWRRSGRRVLGFQPQRTQRAQR